MRRHLLLVALLEAENHLHRHETVAIALLREHESRLR